MLLYTFCLYTKNTIKHVCFEVTRIYSAIHAIFVVVASRTAKMPPLHTKFFRRDMLLHVRRINLWIAELLPI